MQHQKKSRKTLTYRFMGNGNSYLVFILSFCCLFIEIACINNSNNNLEEEQIPKDCSEDTLMRFHMYTSSNLTNVNDIILEHYVKGVRV